VATLLGLWSVGFCVNLQPSEPYLSRYLLEDKNLTKEQLNNDVWPWDVYANLLFLVPLGALAEAVGYRPVILGGLLCREATRVVLIFCEGIPWMAFMQVTYAGAVSVNSVYYAYAALVVRPAFVARATGGAIAAYHGGNILGSLLGELLVNETWVGQHLRVLFYLSWGFTSLGVVCFCLLLPSPLAVEAERGPGEGGGSEQPASCGQGEQPAGILVAPADAGQLQGGGSLQSARPQGQLSRALTMVRAAWRIEALRHSEPSRRWARPP